MRGGQGGNAAAVQVPCQLGAVTDSREYPGMSYLLMVAGSTSGGLDEQGWQRQRARDALWAA